MEKLKDFKDKITTYTGEFDKNEIAKNAIRSFFSTVSGYAVDAFAQSWKYRFGGKK